MQKHENKKINQTFNNKKSIPKILFLLKFYYKMQNRKILLQLAQKKAMKVIINKYIKLNINQIQNLR